MLYTVRQRRWSYGDEVVVAQVLATGESKVLLQNAADARYLPTGHLLFMRQGTLFAVRFDASRGADVVETDDRVPVLGVAGRKLLRGTRTTDASAAVSLDDFLDVINGELAAPTGAK